MKKKLVLVTVLFGAGLLSLGLMSIGISSNHQHNRSMQLACDSLPPSTPPDSHYE